MSYMDHNAAFAPAGGIQELSFDEIEMINGAGLFDFIGGVFGVIGDILLVPFEVIEYICQEVAICSHA